MNKAQREKSRTGLKNMFGHGSNTNHRRNHGYKNLFFQSTKLGERSPEMVSKYFWTSLEPVIVMQSEGGLGGSDPKLKVWKFIIRVSIINYLSYKSPKTF
jgi:hypothetical protein